jgi:preprotein translocase subunit SecA
MVNEKLKSSILEVIDNQMSINQPKCTKRTFRRLVELGYSEVESKEMIGHVLVEEMYFLMKDHVPFNESRFAKKLSKLPEYFWESEDKGSVETEAAPSVGRNEPCPCGSGKKYKKCCGG